jgi:hypothetical protein
MVVRAVPCGAAHSTRLGKPFFELLTSFLASRRHASPLSLPPNACSVANQAALHGKRYVGAHV